MENNKNYFTSTLESTTEPTKEQFDRVVTEHERRFRTLCRAACRITLIICIAVMAYHFNNAKILGWWVVPAFMMNGLIENYIAKENDNEQ